jgi:hypothetical protein
MVLAATGKVKLMIDFEKVIAKVVQRPPLRLVAIDGLPLADKSTLADRLAMAVAAECAGSMIS